MSPELFALATTAVGVGFLHTLAGPDHYVPIVALARIRGWSRARAMAITLLFGALHVSSAAFLGLVGLNAVSRLIDPVSVLAETAAWMLISFGLTYGIWGLRRARVDRDVDRDNRYDGAGFMPVVLALFVVGPCEPLLPLLALPAAQRNPFAVGLVLAVFGVVTMVTMAAAVAVLLQGTMRVRLPWTRRYAHALAGGTLLLSGLGMRFLGV